MNAQLDAEGKLLLKQLQQQLADKGEVIHWCIDWLEHLACGEKVGEIA